MPQENIVVFLLVLGTEEITNRGVTCIVKQNQQIVKYLDGIGLEDVDLGHLRVFRVQWVLKILDHCGLARVYYTVRFVSNLCLFGWCGQCTLIQVLLIALAHILTSVIIAKILIFRLRNPGALVVLVYFLVLRYHLLIQVFTLFLLDI